MTEPIFQVTSDLAGGIVISTNDKWLVEDACESVAQAASPKTLVDLAVAIDGFDQKTAIQSSVSTRQEMPYL